MRTGTDARERSVGAAGSTSDFDLVYLRHHGELYRLLYRIIGSPEESEDLVQETFLRFHGHEFEPGREHNHRAWLFRVASNLAYNWLRARERGERRDDAAVAMLAPDVVQSADPTGGVERRCEVDSVRKALASLPQRQSRLLLLRYAGLSYREVAEALDVAPGSVGTMLARAEAAFEEVFERHEQAERRSRDNDL